MSDDSLFFLDKPREIKISLTNVCNYRCVMCYNPKLLQRRGFIEEGLMYRILDDCRETGVEQVALGATGEPLLHPRYLSFLERAKSLGLRTSTTSNCSRLSRDMSDRILDLGLDRLNISLYSSTPEEHRKYTGSDESFEAVTENIRYFLNRWNETGKKARVNMWFLQLPEINNYERYMTQWKPLCDRIGLDIPMKEPINWSGRVGLVGKQGRSWILDCIPGHLRLRLNQQIQCGHVRYYLHVLHTGDVLPCCNIPEAPHGSELLFGNLSDSSIMDVWTSGKYLDFKRNHARKNISSYGQCRVCSDIQTIRSLHIPPLGKAQIKCVAP